MDFHNSEDFYQYLEEIKRLQSPELTIQEKIDKGYITKEEQMLLRQQGKIK